jgi:glycosyltransferase involved in cell wall biosynthesis
MSTSPPGFKILQLITHLDPGGAQETVVALAVGLRERGHRVTVASAPKGADSRRLTDAGIDLVSLRHLVRPISPASDARGYAEIARLIRTGSFDVVHTHSSKAGVLGRLAARRARVPAIVHTSHGLPVNPDMPRVGRAVLIAAERIASRACDRIVAVSQATATELAGLGLAQPRQLIVIPSGVRLPDGSAPDRPEARRRLGLPSRGPMIGWVGRHFPQKRPEDVIRAARRVLDRIPEATVVLAGGGPDIERTRAGAADDQRIRVLGQVDDVASVYAAIDVFLLASAWEGLPRTVLEALAAGVPVVSTRVSGVEEVIRQGTNGFLLEPGDSQGLGDAVIQILLDPSLAASMSEAARRTITAEYSDQRMVDRTAALYEEVIDTRSPRRIKQGRPR